MQVGVGEQVLGHLLVFGNCDSRTAVLLGSPVSSPGTLALPPMPAPPREMWLCAAPQAGEP